MTAAPQAFAIAGSIRDAFDRYLAGFIEVTRRARRRFELREWKGVQNDAAQRLDLYADAVSALVARLREQGEPDRRVWQEARDVFASIIHGRLDRELADSFFNSIVRRAFGVVGQEGDLEFTTSRPVERWCEPEPTVVRLFRIETSVAAMVHSVVTAHGLAAPYRHLDEDCALAAARVEAALLQADLGAIEHVETLLPLFFRNKGAYVIGRVKAQRGALPLALALVHRADGVSIDAVLLCEDELSVLFSYSHSYFHAPILDYAGTLRFLHSLMPRKRVAELYNALGHHKHGKTELYRELRDRLAARGGERFEFAPGRRGMVMIVFTLPSVDLVFKVIKDRFDPPKRGSRDTVKQAYRLVTHHDRVGRLVDAQEFEHLEFDRARFTPDLLETLLTAAGEVVEPRGDQVVLRHVYAERRVTPLDLLLEQGPRDVALAALLDWGAAVKNLAAADIFPGDLFLKNFGVTRHGRVVFYDYDEITLVTRCRFRRLPEPRYEEDETAAEPWFQVGDDDIFPEEILRFLGIPDDLKAPFLAAHGDLFGVAYWHAVQDCHARGVVIDVFPYGAAARLRPLAEGDGALAA